jgi:hypothetical protein
MPKHHPHASLQQFHQIVVVVLTRRRREVDLERMPVCNLHPSSLQQIRKKEVEGDQERIAVRRHASKKEVEEDQETRIVVQVRG